MGKVTMSWRSAIRCLATAILIAVLAGLRAEAQNLQFRTPQNADTSWPVEPRPIRLPPTQKNAPPAARFQPAASAVHAQAFSELVPAPEQVVRRLPPPDNWDLARITLLAEQYNPILRRAQARIESARGDMLQAGLYPNPRFDTNNPEVFAGPNSSYNVGFMQDVVVKGKLRLNRSAASQAVRQKQYDLVSDRFEMLTAMRVQFYGVLASQRRVEVLTELMQIASGALRAAEGRVKAGEGTRPEVLLLKTEYQRAEIALKNAYTMLEGDRKQLAALIGVPDLPIARVSGSLERGLPVYDEEYLRRFATSENSQVQSVRQEIIRNQVLLQRARVEPYPNIRVGPAYNFSPNPVAANGSQQFWLTLQFDIPTWDRNQGNIRAARADIADSVANLGATQNDLLNQVADLLSRHRAARERAERIEREILPNATQAQLLVKDGFVKGILDISTFLQAQRTLTETTLDYVDALEEAWTTAAELAKLLQLEQFP
jgi:cobalt-zinc-cadmium efflux system outer membrane protein